MKTGRTLEDLAKELVRQQEAMRDFLAPTSAMEMTVTPAADVAFSLGRDATFGINELGHDQIGGYTQIPSPYYDRMRREQPALLAQNVNTWLHSAKGSRGDNTITDTRLVRTLDSKVRAFLSDSYRRIDNVHLAEAVLPVMMDMKLEIVSCEVTERRLFLKAVHPSINRDIQKIRPGARMGDGSHVIFDTCAPALSISNSEVGSGRILVESGMLTKACTNLCWFPGAGWKRRHVGVKQELVDQDTIELLLSDDTKKATDRAILLQIRDVVRAAFDEKVFEGRIGQIQGTVAREITADPVKVVELTAKKFGFTEGERSGILNHLIRGADLSQYGLFNAVTRTAEDLASYDRATELERAGMRVVELNHNEWKELAVTPA